MDGPVALAFTTATLSMHLTAIDWAIMIFAFAVYLGIGFFVGRKASDSFESYFLSGRSMPWWLLGTSMVATTFATDTPNLVTGIVRKDGVYGNWVWWAFLLTGASTVFFFSRLWRRSDVLTDIEFYELRYSGRIAAFLRGFRAVYLGVFFNLIVMANVTLAAIKIGNVLLGLSPLQTIAIASVITVAYSMVGGLTGVLLTDLVQFVVAMAGAVGAAVYIVQLPQVGGLGKLLSHPAVVPHMGMIPDFSTVSTDVLVSVFLLPLAVQWWSSYYPGAEPGGGGYVVQRVLAAKSESHAVGATLSFNAMHYALRPWPWILVALASLIVFPDLASLRARFPNLPENMIQHDLVYPAMLTFLPHGLLGIVVTSLIAAYMSTMSTQVNWGSSILVNDVYLRFMNPKATESQKVWMGRWLTLALMVLSCLLALAMRDALSSFNLMLQIGAGTGLLLLLRWFWWRINAAAELTAMTVSFLMAAFFFFAKDLPLSAWQQTIISVGVTTIAWVIACFVGQPTDRNVLISFYRKIQPGGPGWGTIAEEATAGGTKGSTMAGAVTPHLGANLAATLLTCAGVWALIFAGGFAVYGRWPSAGAAMAVSAGCSIGLWRLWPRVVG